VKFLYVILLRLLSKVVSGRLRFLVDVYHESPDGTTVTRQRVDLVHREVISSVTYRLVADS